MCDYNLILSKCARLYHFRQEMRATLDSICHDIEQINFVDYTCELLQLLWPKVFPTEDIALAGPVSAVHDKFMGQDRAAIPFGTLLASLSSVDFWKKFAASRTLTDRLAAAFAIRLVCAGITECVVERLFSHVNWLMGMRRHRLNELSLESLAMLTYADPVKK